MYLRSCTPFAVQNFCFFVTFVLEIRIHNTAQQGQPAFNNYIVSKKLF